MSRDSDTEKRLVPAVMCDLNPPLRRSGIAERVRELCTSAFLRLVERLRRMQRKEVARQFASKQRSCVFLEIEKGTVW